jgi:hypothetical protein
MYTTTITLIAYAFTCLCLYDVSAMMHLAYASRFFGCWVLFLSVAYLTIQWLPVYFIIWIYFNHKTSSYMIVLCAVKSAAKETSSLQCKRWKRETCWWEDGDWCPAICSKDVCSYFGCYLCPGAHGASPAHQGQRHRHNRTKLALTSLRVSRRLLVFEAARLAHAGESCFDY